MPHYAALDVSNAETAIHVVDEAGRTVWHGLNLLIEKHEGAGESATLPSGQTSSET